MSEIVYEDQFGEVIDRRARGFMEIRWYESMATMDGDVFNL